MSKKQEPMMTFTDDYTDQEKLMLRLLNYAAEYYNVDCANPSYSGTIKAACKRLGIAYCANGFGITKQIAEVLKDRRL